MRKAVFLFIVAFAVFTTACNRTEDSIIAETYNGFRKLALNAKDSTALKVNPALSEMPVYSAIIDYCVDGTEVMTLLCYIDGTTSMFYSTGGGFIGLGTKYSIKGATLSFLAYSSVTLSEMERADTFEPPIREGQLTFYIITKDGVFKKEIDASERDTVSENIEHLIGKYDDLVSIVMSNIPDTNMEQIHEEKGLFYFSESGVYYAPLPQ